jgi:organic radical activating enzyme
MNSAKYDKMTQKFSTFGDKLLQHTDVLDSIQNAKIFRPITVQLAPTEGCDLDCSYCSVANRNVKLSIPFDVIEKGIRDFASLGAKSIELTGGGNPLTYRRINDVIAVAHECGLEIGVITNSTDPARFLNASSISSIKWIRISMSVLDVNDKKEFKLECIPQEKLGMSYIVNEKTTERIIERIAEDAKRFNVKFVRIAPDCLSDYSLRIKNDWDDIINRHNIDGKMFIKEIEDNFHPYPDGCYVGMVRPYWVSTGVYICSSHVLKTRTYEPEWKLYDIQDVVAFYSAANARHTEGNPPYHIDISKCFHCYYFNNNKLLHTVVSELPDKNFA